MRLIDDWRHAWRFHTVIGALLLALLNCPELMAALSIALPPEVMRQVNVWAPIALIVLRLVRQNIPARDAAVPDDHPADGHPPP